MTEDGIYGLGDATLNGRELAVASYLTDHVIPLLIGRDARRIEDIWHYLYKGAYWRRGPVTMFEVRVKDNGQGVPDAIRQTLFDPFVSFGKPNGTGLGLAIVSKIVQDHAGSAVVEASSNGGTTILVKLPRAEQPVATYSQTNVA